MEVEHKYLCTKCIEYTTPFKNNLIKRIFLFLSILSVLVIPIYTNGYNTKDYTILYVLKPYQEKVPPLTRANLVAELKKLHMEKFANIAIAQAIMESGFGTSDLYKKTNNLFGMTLTPIIWNNRLDSSYDVIVDGTLYKFAVYKNWVKSLQDYCCWLDSNWLSDMKIIENVGSRYCPDKGYKEKVIKILKEL